MFETRSRPGRVVGVTVDHGLQPRLGGHADSVVAQMARMGADETAAVRVTVEPGGRGLEAAARGRYAVLEEVAARMDSRTVLLGHTMDDQAETVLLGLTRGSGGRSIAGMRPAFDCFYRPLLGLTRQQTEDACRAEGVEFWNDPHNTDPRFTRARIRHRVMRCSSRGGTGRPGHAREDGRAGASRHVEALDRLAEEALVSVRTPRASSSPGWRGVPTPSSRGVLRLAALDAGSPGSGCSTSTSRQ